MYCSAKRSGSKQTVGHFTGGDSVDKAGFGASAQARDEFLLLDCRYSFHKNETLAFAGVLGLYGGRFNLDVNGAVTEGGQGSAKVSASTSSPTTVPLPLTGLSPDGNSRAVLASARMKF